MTSMLSTSLLIAAGGALGAVARFWAGSAAARLLGSGWPWGTLFVNILGGLAMGSVMAFAGRGLISTESRNFLAVGVLGGFTTFSAFSAEVVQMAERGAWVPAFSYIIFSVALSVAAVFLGMKIFA